MNRQLIQLIYAPPRRSRNRTAPSSEVREIRINPIVPSESVLVATARSMRPKKAEELAPRDTRKHVETCPFCRGNEHKTPPRSWPGPIAATGRFAWSKSLSGAGRLTARRPATFTATRPDGYGRHEVIIDHHEHGIAVQDMAESHLAALFGVYQTRMRQLFESDERLKYVLVFKNFGPAAGASIPHTHSQVIAMPVVPENVDAEVKNSAAHYAKHHHCIFCALIDEALTFEATIYDRNSGAVRRKISVGQYVSSAERNSSRSSRSPAATNGKCTSCRWHTKPIFSTCAARTWPTWRGC
jgi:UDPglucose--hexose-1-phosphate uridylyltransferase